MAMRKEIFIILIFPSVLAFSNSVYSNDIVISSDSTKTILQAMDLAVKSNYWSYLYTQESGRMDSIYKGDKKTDSLKLKNPNTALFYAAVPGFFVHGAGHFYAGKSKIGMILLTTGTLGGLMFIVGEFAAAWQKHDITTGTEITIIAGGTLFFGTWLYDIFRAPKIVEAQNINI